MENEFIPYEQALAIKELGFDEKCMGRYYSQNKELPIFMQWTNAENFNNKVFEGNYPFISAPLYQQAFRWFRENHNLHVEITSPMPYKIELWGFRILSALDSNMFFQNSGYELYEEAELECLKKLIEIVKNK